MRGRIAIIIARFAIPSTPASVPLPDTAVELIQHNESFVALLGSPGLCELVAAPDKRPGLCSLIRVCTERNGSRGHQRAVRHCISSLPMAEALLELSAATGAWRTACTAPWTCSDCRLCTDYDPAVMGILRRAALNMVRTVQQNSGANVSIGLLWDRIGRYLDPSRRSALITTFRLLWLLVLLTVHSPSRGIVDPTGPAVSMLPRRGGGTVHTGP